MEIAHRVISTAGVWVPDRRTMSKSAPPTSKPVGTIEDQSTDRTSVATVVTEHMRFIVEWNRRRAL